MNARHEEAASRAISCVDTEEGLASSNVTSPRDSSGGHCARRGGKEENGANRERVHINDQGGYQSTSVICAQIKYRTSSDTRKGTHRQVPPSSRSC
jgi:hypothetical protein